MLQKYITWANAYSKKGIITSWFWMNKNRPSKLQISHLSNQCGLMQIHRLRFYNANELTSRCQGHCWRDLTTELFISFNFCTNSQLTLRRILLVLKSKLALERINRLGCSKNELMWEIYQNTKSRQNSN